jgi:hypothetical protein
MRELKFRVWSKRDKRFITNDCFVAVTNKGWIYFDTLSVSGPRLNPDLYDILLYTGLVDKQGREIYEGDILEFESQSWLDALNGEPMKKRKEVISWDGERLCWWVGLPEQGFKPNMSTDNAQFLIVGNIYEKVGGA